MKRLHWVALAVLVVVAGVLLLTATRDTNPPPPILDPISDPPLPEAQLAGSDPSATEPKQLPPDRSSPELHEELIVSFFAGRENEDGFLYDISVDQWTYGAYSSAGATEALVLVFDRGQSFGALPMELWLFSYDQEWRLVKKVTESHFVYHKSLDLTGDGVMEIWYECWRGGQGYMHSRAAIVSLVDHKIRPMYAYQGHNFRGARGVDDAGYTAIYHHLDFHEPNREGKVSITETIVKIVYGLTEDDTYGLLSSEESVRVLQLDGQEYMVVQTTHSP